MANKQLQDRVTEDKPIEEKYVKDLVDYHNRSFPHPPHDIKSGAPECCFLLKAHIHTWTGHSKGIFGIWWFKNLVLLLSCSSDQVVFNEQRGW